MSHDLQFRLIRGTSLCGASPPPLRAKINTAKVGGATRVGPWYKKEEEKNNIRALLAVRYDRPSSWRWIGTVDRRPGRCGDINETGRWWKRFPSIVIFDPFFFNSLRILFFPPIFLCESNPIFWFIEVDEMQPSRNQHSVTKIIRMTWLTE